tara:strand:+ start:5130 stop:5339 length:210 start_codon:yes stop_codon:yes gene_type:complete
MTPGSLEHAFSHALEAQHIRAIRGSLLSDGAEQLVAAKCIGGPPLALGQGRPDLTELLKEPPLTHREPP